MKNKSNKNVLNFQKTLIGKKKNVNNHRNLFNKWDNLIEVSI